jgi:oxalate decarboxylase/phosphoglucose isomerase-like protein (cupin superfamily)
MSKVTGKRFVSPDEVETQVFPWGKLQWLSEPRVTGSKIMATGVVTMELGKGHDRHNHEGMEEIIYVLDGEGDQTIEVDGQTLKKHVKKGDLIHLPTSAFHSTLNTGKKKLSLFVVYEKAGPEAFLRSLPDCTVLPPKKVG